MAIKVSIYEGNISLLGAMSCLISGTEGFELCSASPDTVHILADCHDKRPDIILMELTMSELSGIEATRLVKKNFPDIDVMIFTVFEERDHTFEALCAGATGCLLTNMSPTQIINAIVTFYHGGSLISSCIANRALEYFSKSNRHSKKASCALTSREIEVLKHRGMGASYKMIAETCFISIETVYHYVNTLYKKLYAIASS